jgi:hypothetical protein
MHWRRSEVKGIRIKAILAGIAIDILGSILVGVVEGFIIFVIASRAGDTSRQHLLELKSKFLAEFSGLLGTTFSTGLGGYASTRLSRLNNLYNPFIVGVVSLLLGIVASLYGGDDLVPRWKVVLGIVFTVPAALAGGYAVPRSRELASSSV